ncbi:FadR/GntR family transcriptional regulator [Chakrabartyella piscis]|uniref:FadR/GntR family transcriptional regulator n=1 Tax=Chakrabartyella piscis TaxID=2918914 RepID=UPI0029585D4B|nr:FadR/GntR family transcriptional regulator [Chakrabartyella piscis]
MTRVDESVEAIKKMILNKQYDQYGFLPSEGELSETLNVSRATVREAVRTLEVRGFVNRMHGKGIKVCEGGVAEVMTRTMRDMFDQDGITLDEVLEVRWIIESKAIELVTNVVTDAELAELLSYIEAMEGCTEIGADYQENDFCFHKKIVHCSKNKMLISIVNAYSDWLKELILASIPEDENLESTYHYHRHIYEALVQRDAKLAKKYMEEHHTATNKNKRELLAKKKD